MSACPPSPTPFFGCDAFLLGTSANGVTNTVRGADRYGVANNSNIPTPEQAALSVGVRPSCPNASKHMWKTAWKFHKTMLPLLHLTDLAFPRNSSLNLACLWWKALAGNDPASPACDDGLAFDLLPRGTRYVVHPWLSRRCYPRLHHANVEIRTVFLDRAVQDVVVKRTTSRGKTRLISVGAGYDLRSVKLSLAGMIDEAHELDLPEVVAAKGRLLRGRFLRRRRKTLTVRHLPNLVPVDLNDVDACRRALEDILLDDNNNNNDDVAWHTVFLFEGVLIYLDEGVPSRLLRLCADAVTKANNTTASLVLADRLENVPGVDVELGTAELERGGWRLDTWSPKPGLARHMCSATLSSSIRE